MKEIKPNGIVYLWSSIMYLLGFPQDVENAQYYAAALAFVLILSCAVLAVCCKWLERCFPTKKGSTSAGDNSAQLCNEEFLQIKANPENI